MKITIDTKEDSKEEIKNAIKMLYNLIGDKEVFENKGDIFDDGAPKADTNIFGNILDQNNVTKKEDDGGEEKVEDMDNIPHVIEY